MIARSSPWLRAIGLPCMLLDTAALAAMSPACSGPMPNVARPGIRSWATVSRIQATPNSMDAVEQAGQQLRRLHVPVENRVAAVQ